MTYSEGRNLRLSFTLGSLWRGIPHDLKFCRAPMAVQLKEAEQSLACGTARFKSNQLVRSQCHGKQINKSGFAAFVGRINLWPTQHTQSFEQAALQWLLLRCSTNPNQRRVAAHSFLGAVWNTFWPVELRTMPLVSGRGASRNNVCRHRKSQVCCLRAWGGSRG